MDEAGSGEPEDMPLLLGGEEAAASPLLAANVPDDAPPAWYTPQRLLLLFCSMQLLVYMDRGVRSGSSHPGGGIG